ncbi:MAG: GNAT family N-acetyltransferase [Leptolinea sp.]|nr:GNAT family N-acetyltransferase [Leptolinea sp.]
MEVRIDDLTGPEVLALLEMHLRSMSETTPPESMHALGLEALRKPDVTFYTAWENGELRGCGALKAMGRLRGEIKSMRTDPRYLRKGVARSVLKTIIAEARRRGYHRLYLETGTQPFYEPARRLYCSLGFVACPPFEGYTEDPNSYFMTMKL